MSKLPRLALPVTEVLQKDANTLAGGTIGYAKREKNTMGFRELRKWMGKAQPWGCHSVPSRIAPLLVLDNTANECANKMAAIQATANTWNPMLNEWLAILCVYLLHEKLGLRVHFDHDDVEAWANGERPENADPGVDAAQAMIKDLRDAGRKPYQTANAGSEEIWRFTTLSVEKDGEQYPFALLDEQLLLSPIPLSRDAQQLFASVIPWFSINNGNSDWNNVNSYLIRENRGMYGRLIYYLLNRLEGQLKSDNDEKPKKYIQMVSKYLNLAGSFSKDKTKDKTKRTFKELTLEEQAHLPASLTKGLSGFLCSPLESKTPSIEETWTENAVLLPLTKAQRESLSDNFKCQPIEVPGVGGADGVKLCLLPPVHEEIYKFLDKHDGSVELSLRYTTDLEIEVSISFQDEDGIPQNRKKEYSLRESTLWLLESLPYLSLWPDVNLPEDAWKLYFIAKGDSSIEGQPLYALINAVVSSEQKRAELQLRVYQQSPQYLLPNVPPHVPKDVDRPNHTVLKVDGNEGEEVPAAIDDMPWRVYQTDARPRIIGIYSATGKHLANLRLQQKEKETKIIKNKRVRVSFDFGTSATMVYLQKDKEIPRSISDGNKVLDLVPFDMPKRKEEFERYHGILSGERGLLGKINSVAQINDIQGYIDRDSILPYEQGRYLRMDSEVWMKLTPEAETGSSGGKTAKSVFGERLDESYGVYTGLKFPDPNADEAKVEDALFVFFGNLIALVALDARLAGAQKVQVIAACPHDLAQNNLKNYLEVAMNQMSDRYFGGLFEDTLQIYSESDAVRAYMQSFVPKDRNLNLKSGAVIVDIGGGTTDVCAMRNDVVCKTSFGLAGDRLVRRSVIYSTVKKPPSGNTPSELHPGKMELYRFLTVPSKDADEFLTLDHLLKAYESQITGSDGEFLSFPGCENDETGAYPPLAELVDTLIQKFPPAYGKITKSDTLESGKTGDTTPVRALRCLSETIKLRYMLLFYLIARFLEIHKEELGLESMGSIRIFLAGLGSRGLGFCCGKPINVGKGETMKSPFISILERIMQKVLDMDKRVIFNMPQDSDKVEVVTGLLADKKVLGEEMPLAEYDPDAAATMDDDTLVAEAQKEAERIAEVFDAVLDEISAEAPKNRDLQKLKPFCTLFKGLLQKSEDLARLAASDLDDQDMMNKAIDDSRRAMLVGDLEAAGLAVWHYNDVLDYATKCWGERV